VAIEGVVLWYRPSGQLGGAGFIETRVGNQVKQFYFRRFDIISLPVNREHPVEGDRVRFTPSLKVPRRPGDRPLAQAVEILDAPSAIEGAQ
jgi:hypothetical protein